MNRSGISKLMLLLLLPFSEVRSQQMTVQQDSVVIRDNRLQPFLGQQNRNISVLTAAQIRQLPVKSVNELLSYVSGVDVRQRGPWGAQADVSIDGSTFDQVLVLINGVRVSDPQTGHHMMNLSLPLGAIDHIEILRGPAARTYGVNALAGAINIVTPRPEKSMAMAQVYAGSNFSTDTATGDIYYGWGAQASGTIVGTGQTHTVGLAHDEGNGYRHNTGYNSSRLFYQAQARTSKEGELDVFGAYTRNRFGANGFYSAPGDRESVERVETVLGSASYRHQLTERIRITPRVSYRYNNDDYIYIRQKPEVYHNTHETSVLTGELQGTVRTEGGLLGLGAEWRKEQISSSNLGKRERNNAGLYAEYRHLFFQRLQLSGGLYANYNSDYDWQLFPGVDAGLRLSRIWKVFASYTAGQRVPTYTDLYYKGPLNIGNDQLKPELSRYAEAGIACSPSFLQLKASYFYRNVQDMIDWVRTADSLPWQPQNFQEVKTSGWTASVSYPVSKHFGFKEGYDCQFDLSYTYLDQSVRTTEGVSSKYSVEALRHQLTGQLRTTVAGHWDLNLAGRYLQRINNNDYTILDLRLGYHTKSWLVYADLNNLLDTQYKEIGSVLLPGRWLTLGLRYTFQ